MDRRNYLERSVAVFGVATVLSGCLDTVGLGDGDDDEDVAIPEAEAEIESELRGAVGALNRAGLSLRAIEGDLESPDDVEYDPEKPLERIDSAFDHLDAAEEVASDDRLEDVEALRSFADVLERTIDVIASLVDTDLEDDHADAETALEEERFDDARRIVADRRQRVDEDRDRLGPALETLETVDRDRLEALDAIDLEPIADGVATLDHLLSGLDALTGAFESLIDGSDSLADGRDSFEDGMDAVEQAENATSLDEVDEAKEDAKSAFEDAKASFEEAETAFAESTTTLEGVEEPPTALDEQFTTTTCRSTNLEDAAAEFADGTEAALEEDFDAAEEHEQTATDALEDAQDCS